jgi:hypothetical protein
MTDYEDFLLPHRIPVYRCGSIKGCASVAQMNAIMVAAGGRRRIFLAS